MKKITFIFLPIFLFGLYSKGIYSHCLKLNDVLKSVNQHFPLIVSQQEEILAAKNNLLSAKGNFDPNIKFSLVNSPNGIYQYNYLNSEISKQIANAPERVFAGYRVGLGNFPVYQQQNWTYNYGEVQAGVEYPLIRNNKIDSARAKIRERKFEISLQRDNLNIQKLSLFRQSTIAFWSLIAEKKKLLIQQKLLSIAKKRQRWIEKRVEKGDLASIDKFDNMRIIMQREAKVASQEQAFDNSSILLSFFLRDKQGNPIPPSLIDPPSEFDSGHTLSKPGEMKVGDLLKRNPMIHQINDKIDINTVNLELAENDKKPSLMGRAYVSQDFGSNNNVPLNRTTVNLSLVFQMPMYRREAIGRTRAAYHKLEGLYAQESLASQKIENELQIALNSFAWTEKRIAILKKEVELNRKVESAENKKFAMGDGNLFMLNEREQITAESQIKLIDSEQKFYDLLADYAYVISSFRVHH